LDGLHTLTRDSRTDSVVCQRAGVITWALIFSRARIRFWGKQSAFLQELIAEQLRAWSSSTETVRVGVAVLIKLSESCGVCGDWVITCSRANKAENTVLSKGGITSLARTLGFLNTSTIVMTDKSCILANSAKGNTVGRTIGSWILEIVLNVRIARSALANTLEVNSRAWARKDLR
jgi:hypothetical protein